MVKVIVSVGTNLDRKRNVQQAIKALRNIFGPLLCSPVYENAALGFDGPDFYNLVVVFDTSFDVYQVRSQIQRIEANQGRGIGKDRYGSRSLDLDLLLYGNAILYDNGLDVPRREIFEHAYILKPICDLLPGLIHPVTGESFGEIWGRLSTLQPALHLVRDLELD